MSNLVPIIEKDARHLLNNILKRLKLQILKDSLDDAKKLQQNVTPDLIMDNALCIFESEPTFLYK